MDTERNKAVVRRYLTEGPKDEALALASLTEDAVYYDPGAPPSVGHEGQKRRTAALLTAFPDPRFELDDLVAEGDSVAVRWTFHGTHQGPFGPIPATGKRVSMTGITIYRLRDGKIAEARSNFDQMGLMQQLQPAPAAKTS
jgi:steroid delta-isomerase-like uncharacterized protein